MSTIGWRLLSVVGALLLGVALPVLALVVVLGLLRTGPTGALAFGAWLVAMVVVVRLGLRRRRLRA